MERKEIVDPKHIQYLNKVEFWEADKVEWFGPNNSLLPKLFTKSVDRCLNFKVRESDTWIITPPKCGTTWTQEIVWLLKNAFDFDKAIQISNLQRIPFFEYSLILELPIDYIEFLEGVESPRVIKSHLMEEFLPKSLWETKPNIIFVYRDPKDAVISFFHHHQLLHSFSGSLDEFFDAYIDGVVVYSPFWVNVLQFWKRRNEPNVLFITYEELLKDTRGMVYKIADFLKVQIPKEKEEKLLEAVSFSSMKQNPSTNFDFLIKEVNSPYRGNSTFIREGKSGGWINKLTPEQVQRMDDWSSSFLKGTDFPLYNYTALGGND